ncbi:Uma2 family endonuclease [Microcoleus sp. FACHB-672]|uniref:Uma2 family endonuclease n=1 Tax=Microcoleus sp. FACHB-672 TaxID=2692825 RepID=UPI0016821AC8|nr:Uma2 family endonuclease [Microcoleus sp. FACHB-672]MBD2040199.1 Uma2 family endonuclease [Microcoleus sp. FACHB-672]
MNRLIFAEPTLSKPLHHWQPATWEDYVQLRDEPADEEIRLFFNQNSLFIDMGNEGIDHARFNNLFTLLFGFWFTLKPELIFDDLGGCVLEKPNHQGASPDLVLYIGQGSPRWQKGEPRRINLDNWRVPDLVGEVADTTLATDLDEKKQLYAALGIPEYWVVDIRAERVFVFCLQEAGNYKECQTSVALEGLSVSLLEETLQQLNQGTNGSAALWFSQQIANLSETQS